MTDPEATTTPNTDAEIPAGPPSPKATPPQRAQLPKLNRWHAVALTLGLLIGAAAVAIPTTAALSDAESVNDRLAAQNEDATGKLKETSSRLGEEIARATKAESIANTLQASASEVQAREDAVAAREAAVTSTEQSIAANSFGEGIRLVGTNTAAGVYTTGEIAGSCYYVWKTSTASDADIVDNNIVRSGTATVTLRDGDIFESTRCGTWTKVG